MEMEHFYSMTDQNILVNGKITIGMEVVHIYLKMDLNLRVNGIKIFLLDLSGKIFQQLELIT